MESWNRQWSSTSQCISTIHTIHNCSDVWTYSIFGIWSDKFLFMVFSLIVIAYLCSYLFDDLQSEDNPTFLWIFLIFRISEKEPRIYCSGILIKKEKGNSWVAFFNLIYIFVWHCSYSGAGSQCSNQPSLMFLACFICWQWSIIER